MGKWIWINGLLVCIYTILHLTHQICFALSEGLYKSNMKGFLTNVKNPNIFTFLKFKCHEDFCGWSLFYFWLKPWFTSMVSDPAVLMMITGAVILAQEWSNTIFFQFVEYTYGCFLVPILSVTSRASYSLNSVAVSHEYLQSRSNTLFWCFNLFPFTETLLLLQISRYSELTCHVRCAVWNTLIHVQQCMHCRNLWCNTSM